MRLKLHDKILLILSFSSIILIIAVNFAIDFSVYQLLIISSLVFIASFATTYAISLKFSRRLTNLIFSIEEMAAGNLSKKLKSYGHDEISQLTNALNELRSRLQTGVAIDVSKHKELSQAKTDFVAIASHQLRTPLSIIKWYVDFVASGDAGELTDEQKKYLDEVYKSNERLIELVNALLDVSRIDVGTFAIEPEPTDIVERAEEALKRYKKEIDKKHIKVEKIFDKIPRLKLDPRLTKIFFENIISNSIKYSPEGGVIQIVIKMTDKDVLIKISDTGPGIPREQQPKIFTKLFRADNAKKIESIGTGLGLYITKAIIEKSGGRIWFQSPSFDLLLSDKNKSNKIPLDKQNQGTTFFITIPLKGMRAKKGSKKLTGLS